MTTAAPNPIRTPNSKPAILVEMKAVVQELRPALAAILESLRPPVQRASELRDILGLDQNLSWSFFNAATTNDHRKLVTLLPGRRSMERLFAAAGSKGVPGETIERTRQAFQQFESLVARHAGSREAFASMLAESGVGGTEPDASWGLKQRRALFKGNSLVFGRQVRAAFSAKIMHPSASTPIGRFAPATFDEVLVVGVLGLHRTRLNASFRLTASTGTLTGAAPRVPLDPDDPQHNTFGLVRRFCSTPLPEFRLCETEGSFKTHELASEAFGPSGELNYHTGWITRGSPDTTTGTSIDTSIGHLKTITVPHQVYICDFLIHNSVWGERPPLVSTYVFPADGSKDLREADLLPVPEKGEYLGEGIDAARTIAIPRYAEVLAYAMERMGWKQEEFRVLRCRVDYPVMYTRIWVRLEGEEEK